MLKACIVGCGAISPMHANGILNIPEGELVAVCDIVPEKADKMAQKYGCRAIYSYEEVLNDPNIDVVHICTPHYLHVDMAIRALRAGKQVLQEKPVALSTEDLETLIKTEKETGGRVCVSLQNRTNATIRRLAEEIKKDDSLGELLGVSGFLVWDRGKEYYAQDSWRGHWATEGGSLMCNQAIHLIDLMHLFAGPAKRVKAHIATKLYGDIIETEDTADAIFEFKNGAKGVFFGTNTYNSSSPITLELDFQKVRFRYADQALYKIKRGEPAVCVVSDTVGTMGKNVWGTGHEAVISDFYRYLLGKNDSYLSLDSVLPSSKTLLALYKSGKLDNQWVDV